ncbi:transporter substrate-binding domain-containing protein [Roseovarius nanhaiticus]|uniref:transporter substrate-binding domain-containing protein n=1 Tax=Roseovarius nanhaiticus TaxID=573024 RepID=UPI00248FEB4D|nr:transporter substrate-binding domain-containing protein [Roseovarius nanhaiticus]
MFTTLPRLGARVIALLLLLLATLPATAQNSDVPIPEMDIQGPLVFLTKESPPFSFVGANGAWSGITIDAVTNIASDLGYEVEWREDTLPGMLSQVEAGTVDGAAAAITITPAREAELDFTFPFYTTGLGIAIDPDAGSGWLQVVRNMFTWQFAVAIATLSTVLLIAGAAMWFFERGHNEEFPRDPIQGLGDGFWWAAVTMTTVGYGDKAPRTLGGRIVGLIWMFTAMLIVASFTAAIAASLTVGSLGNPIQGVTDLKNYRIGVVENSTGADEMVGRGIRISRYDGPREALDALVAGEVSAFVYDRPLMQWIVTQEYESDIRILEDEIGRQDYGIALPTDSELREPMNRALLSYLRTDAWSRVLDSYVPGR